MICKVCKELIVVFVFRPASEGSVESTSVAPRLRPKGQNVGSGGAVVVPPVQTSIAPVARKRPQGTAVVSGKLRNPGPSCSKLTSLVNISLKF